MFSGVAMKTKKDIHGGPTKTYQLEFSSLKWICGKSLEAVNFSLEGEQLLRFFLQPPNWGWAQRLVISDPKISLPNVHRQRNDSENSKRVPTFAISLLNAGYGHHSLPCSNINFPQNVYVHY